MHAAAKSNRVDMLAMLYERGEDLHAQLRQQAGEAGEGGEDEQTGVSPLHLASQCAAVACVEFLLRHGAGINSSSEVSSVSCAMCSRHISLLPSLRIIRVYG